VRDEEAVVALLRRETFTWFVRCVVIKSSSAKNALSSPLFYNFN